MKLIWLLSAGLVLAGCASGVAASDSAQVREEFSQQRYEEAMRKAGRTSELEREKASAEARGEL